MARTTHDPTTDDDTTTAFDRLAERLRHVRRSDGDGNGVGRSGEPDDADGMILGAPIVLPDPPADLHVTDHRLAGFDLRSVGSFAVRFFACVMGMVLAGVVVLWVIASVLGLVSAFEDFMDGIGFSGFHLLSIEFLFGLALLSSAFAAFAVGMTLVAAGLYNVLASRRGGVRIFVSETTVGAASIDLTGADAANGNGHDNGNGNGKAATRTKPALRPVRRGPLRRVATPAGNGRARPTRNGSTVA